jgi:hypothetical protein
MTREWRLAPSRRSASRGRACGIAFAILALAWAWPDGFASAASAAVDPCEVRVELTDGTTVEGVLDVIDDEAVQLFEAEAARRVPVNRVRRVVRTRPPSADARSVRVACCDGSAVEGDDFLWEGAAEAVVIRGGERIEMPIERVRTVGWHPRPAADAVEPVDPAWLAALPAEPAGDLVAVSRGPDFELVECAITAVAPDTVTVMLDGERIPVKRGKVLGLAWLRPATPPATATRVRIAGGTLAAGRIAWTPRELLLDGVVKVPGHLLDTIDYAAGRTIALVSLPMERMTAEPFFGGLATVEGMAAFFGPRVVPPAGASGAEPALVVRPRSAVVWRVPTDSRRFRARVVRMAGVESAATVRVAVRLDDRQVWEQSLDSARPGEAIDVAAADVRRLSIEVDFVAGDMGCPVRFDDAVFEK